MKLTDEQSDIIETDKDIKVNAVAGSGKTTTLIEYAKSRNADKKLLYIAFNSSVRKSARDKFTALGLSNVRIETAHSLAFDNIVKHSQYKLSQGYKTNQIKDILSINLNSRDKHAPYVLANHIKKFASFYCNSKVARVQSLDYRSLIGDPVAKAFVNSYYNEIEHGTRVLLAMMLRAEIDISHDFYLKLFQLKEPKLRYDYILFDEGQDASPAMLDVFLKQNTKKIIVGDTHQQIYSWRYAINSLENVHDFDEYPLNTSFRLDADIARLANSILKWKEHFTDYKENVITGVSKRQEIKSKAVIARTNLRLLIKAIDMITSDRSIRKIYFEGNLNSYTYAGEGASLYDVLNLRNENFHLIRDDLMKGMKSLDELKEYAEQSEETEISMMIDIVEEYGNEIPDLLKTLKEKHVENNDRKSADVIFSTVHRCKGLEYDEITLEKDFINEDSILKLIKKDGLDYIDKPALAEEVNLLYVAVTRTGSRLRLPEELTDKYSKELILNSGRHTLISNSSSKPAFNKYSFNTRKDIPKKKPAYEIKEWTPEMDKELEKRFNKKVHLKFIAEYFCTSKKVVLKRILELGLVVTEIPVREYKQ
ncbi:MAG: UvrD-helicase domain-containing protein [Ignavibacteria bacterium]